MEQRRKNMNYKARSLRAVIAVLLFSIVLILSADAIAHTLSGDVFNYGIYAVVSLAVLALAVALFAWNAVQYSAAKRN